MSAETSSTNTERLQMLLLSHEKTIRYAQGLIDQGELLEGQGVLNAETIQLQKGRFEGCSQEVETQRLLLLSTIAQIK